MRLFPGAVVGLLGQHAARAQAIEDLGFARPLLEEALLQREQPAVGLVVEDELFAAIEDRHGGGELVECAGVRSERLSEIGARGLELGRVEGDAGRAIVARHLDDVEARAPPGHHRRGAGAEHLLLRPARRRALARRALEQLDAARDRVAGVLRLDGAHVGGIDPGEFAEPVARPGGVADRIEQAAQRLEVARGARQRLAQPARLEPVAGDVADAHHGASGDGAPLGLEVAAAEAHDRQPEPLAAFAQLGDTNLELLRLLRWQPRPEPEHAAQDRHVADEGRIALDVRLAGGEPPNDGDLRFRGEEGLRAIEIGVDLVQGQGQRGLALQGAPPAAQVHQRHRRGKQHEPDEEGENERVVAVAKVAEHAEPIHEAGLRHRWDECRRDADDHKLTRAHVPGTQLPLPHPPASPESAAPRIGALYRAHRTLRIERVTALPACSARQGKGCRGVLFSPLRL